MPVAASEVHWWCDRDPTDHVQHTDALGHASLAISGGVGAASLCVVAAGHLPEIVRLASTEGAIEVVLDRGARVSGTVWVDGAPALAPLHLELVTRELGNDPALPAALRERIAAAGSSRIVTTDDRGHFEVGGLPPNWIGALRLPKTHWFVPGAEASVWRAEVLPLARPATDLVLHTTALPALRGQVLVAEGGGPLPGATVAIHTEFLGGITAGGTVTTDVEGRFTMPLVPSAAGLERAWAERERRSAFVRGEAVCWRAPGLALPVTVALQPEHLAAEPVQIQVSLAPKTHFLALTTEGQPVAGARVDVALGVPSGADGRGWFQGAPFENLVGAARFAVVPAVARHGTGTEADPWVYALPRNNLVQIVVVDARGAAAQVAQLRLASQQPIFAGRRFGSDFDREFGRSSRLGESTGRRQDARGQARAYWEGQIQLPLDGRVDLHSLEPGVEVAVEARDRFGTVVASASFLTPGFGGSHEERLVVAGELRSLRGRVVSSRGQPLDEAVVELLLLGRRAILPVRPDGSFATGGLRVDGPVQLVARARGHAPHPFEAWPAAWPETPIELVLAPGRTVTLRVVGDDGQVIPVYGYPLGFERSQAQVLGAGTYLFEDLPAVVQFVAELNGRRFSIEHDTAQPDATLKLPTPALVWLPASRLPEAFRAMPSQVLVQLQHLDEVEARPVVVPCPGSADQPVAVLPGRYRATLLQRTAQVEGGLATGIERQVVLRPAVVTELRLDETTGR
ncbi:MAG: hypothetical protein JNK49_00095 [Planctomycetes bacterium]|nr:hypothetical protein [Planctomycetota bacterium]